MSIDTLKVMDEREHFQYKGRDGRFYPTTEALARAAEAWKREHFQYKD